MFLSINLHKKAFVVFSGILIAFAVALHFFVNAYAESEEKSKGINVPIIMYHSILKDDARQGLYVISPVLVEKDFVYLKEKGCTPVFVNDLIRYVNYGEKLPEKPVVITFDDGCYNNYYYIFPLLKKYNFKAVFSVVGEYTFLASESGETPNPNYSYMRWEDITEMRKSSLAEICSHSYGFHNLSPRYGVCQKNGESYEDYRRQFLNDTFKLQNMLNENCGFKPNVYTYPFGANDESSRRLVKNCGFEASMGVEEKPNIIVKNSPECLYNLHRYNRPAGINTEDFMKKALKG